MHSIRTAGGRVAYAQPVAECVLFTANGLCFVREMQATLGERSWALLSPTPPGTSARVVPLGARPASIAIDLVHSAVQWTLALASRTRFCCTTWNWTMGITFE